jgi:probable rRNA maturation factor
VAVEVFAADEQSDQPVDTLRWIRLAEAVLQEEELAGDAELSVLFVDERSISELNARFLGKDGPTDVLAFPIDEEPVESGRSPDSGGTGPGMPSEPEDMPVLLGDIVICPAVAFRNAPEHAGTYEDELALLVVHGLLHLMGMDHDEDDEAEEMEAKERELLARHHAQIRAEAWPIKRGDGAEAAGEGSVPLVDGAKGPGDAAPGAVDSAPGAPDAVSGAVAEAGPVVNGDLGAGTGAGQVPGQDMGKGPEAGEDDPAGEK